MDVRVLDNVISSRYSQYLFDRAAALPWTFVPNLSYGQTNNYDAAGFNHTYYLAAKFNQKEPKDIASSEYDLVKPLLLEAFDKFNIPADLSNVFRSRARMTLNRPESKIEDRHVDYNFAHWVLLYYINTTDGNTVLYDGERIIETVQPRRGRCVLFNGLIEHASSSSTQSPRIVLNTNLII